MMKRGVLCLLSLTGGWVFAQPAPAKLEFEVASIKPAPPPTGPGIRVSMGGDAGRIDYSNVSLRDMITRAYKVKTYQVSGPDWLSSERFDVAAKYPANATKEQVPQMLQSLLEDRFKLTLRRETKELPVYALVVGKNGAKLKRTDEKGNMQMSMGPKGRRLTAKVPLAGFVDALSNMVDRPVVDMTQLEGSYEITLDWAAGDSHEIGMRMGAPMMHGPGGPAPENAPEAESGPSLFTAVQEQLGLKLEARKSPIEFLIVEHVEKLPTEN